MQRLQVNEKKATEAINKRDKKRASYYNFYTQKVWGKRDSYRFCIDRTGMEVSACAHLLAQLVQTWEDCDTHQSEWGVCTICVDMVPHGAQRTKEGYQEKTRFFLWSFESIEKDMITFHAAGIVCRRRTFQEKSFFLDKIWAPVYNGNRIQKGIHISCSVKWKHWKREKTWYVFLLCWQGGQPSVFLVQPCTRR